MFRASLVPLLKAIKASAFLEGDFVTRAGHKTTYYVDKYRFETDPALLEAITDALVHLFPDSAAYDRIAAPELGAVSLAAVISIKLKKPFVIVKKDSKTYGTKNLIEGVLNPGERVVVLEDILTTGGAALRACEILANLGNPVVHIVAVLNRQEGADEAISQKGVSFSTLFTKDDLFSC